MIKRNNGVSIRTTARSAGVLYMVISVAALFGEVFVRGKFLVFSDGRTTVANILAHEQLYRAGGAADLVAFACDAIVAILLYQLLRPVNRSLAILAASLRLLHAAIASVNTLNYFAPLIVLGTRIYTTAFTSEQIQSFVIWSLRLHGGGYNIALVFFGLHCVCLGYLIIRSWFLPKALGAAMAVAGACYLINSFSSFVFPALKSQIYPYILIPGGLAEWALTLWLVIVGLNTRRWNEQARASVQLQPD